MVRVCCDCSKAFCEDNRFCHDDYMGVGVSKCDIIMRFFVMNLEKMVFDDVSDVEKYDT